MSELKLEVSKKMVTVPHISPALCGVYNLFMIHGFEPDGLYKHDADNLMLQALVTYQSKFSEGEKSQEVTNKLIDPFKKFTNQSPTYWIDPSEEIINQLASHLINLTRINYPLNTRDQIRDEIIVNLKSNWSFKCIDHMTYVDQKSKIMMKNLIGGHEDIFSKIIPL